VIQFLDQLLVLAAVEDQVILEVVKVSVVLVAVV
tara:strand:+ start:234 stop:335 length:102 start_codon:yes stop_codon:yes gene_type:complete